jgi:hypothetical protein
MARRLFFGLIILFATLVLPACSKPAAPAAEQTTATAPAQPAVNTAARMADHFGKVRDLEAAVIRGDLESARADAQWIADHQETAGLPPGTEVYVMATRNAARAVAASTSLGNAGVAAAFAVADCGECHAAAKVTPRLPEASAPPPAAGTAARMLAHQYAVELMYRGLAAPSEALWKQGAEALKGSPLTDKEAAKAGTEVVAFETRVHDLAGRAAQATDTGSKIAIYGELLGGCSGCHAMHGRVLGSGLPKTN